MDGKPRAPWARAAVAKWRPTDDQTYSASVTLYPELGDLGEFRVVSSRDALSAVDQQTGL